MKIGTLCYATCQGLGYLAKSFYDHGIVTHPIVVEHTTHENHPEWYSGCPSIHIRDVRRSVTIGHLVQTWDAALFFETPFDWSLVQLCKEVGIPTILMPMYECTPEQLPVEPDYWFFPSLLDAQEFMPHVYWEGAGTFSSRRDGGMGVLRIGAFTPVPVDVPWRQRTKAEVFVHNSGHGGLKGRNGTEELIDSLQFIKSPCHIILRSQQPKRSAENYLRGLGAATIEVVGQLPYDQLWDQGDAFIFPEKFNGLSLPLQEARAAGMLVMGADRFPMNRWLPTGPLVPVKSTRRNRIGNGYREFDEAVIDPQDIANFIDAWYGRDITTYSLEGRLWASEMSWENLGPAYTKLLQEIVEG